MHLSGEQKKHSETPVSAPPSWSDAFAWRNRQTTRPPQRPRRRWWCVVRHRKMGYKYRPLLASRQTFLSPDSATSPFLLTCMHRLRHLPISACALDRLHVLLLHTKRLAWIVLCTVGHASVWHGLLFRSSRSWRLVKLTWECCIPFLSENSILAVCAVNDKDELIGFAAFDDGPPSLSIFDESIQFYRHNWHELFKQRYPSSLYSVGAKAAFLASCAFSH